VSGYGTALETRRRHPHGRFFGRWLVIAALVPTLGVLTGESGEGADGTGTISGRVDSRRTRTAPAVVYIEKIPGKKFPPPEKHAVMDQKDLLFVPHVLPVLVGTVVDFPNSDAVRHSVFSSKRSAKRFNLGTYPPGEAKSVVMDTPGAGSVTLLCTVHAEMAGYVVVVETPYFATTDRGGNFSIDGVPVGEYQLSVWHEALKGQTKGVTVTAGKTAEVVFEKLKRR